MILSGIDTTEGIDIAGQRARQGEPLHGVQVVLQTQGIQGVGGVGLGLSIVKSLVEGMGGEVSYRRVLGDTVFAVRVPLAKSIPEVTKRAAEMEPISP